MTRQNFYKAKKQRDAYKLDSDFIVSSVLEVRREQPRLGGRKLLKLLGEQLEKAGIQVGRDRFFDVLREKNLLVERRRRFARTTDSRHNLPVFHNLIKDLEIAAPNQVWVSDITYIRTGNSFIYLSLITDAYSRKIVGWNAGDTLEAIGCLNALQEALKALPADCSPIHHSDRGCQYCCHAYVDALTKAGLTISMTEQNHCYENALAERVNGIVKDEYNLGARFIDKKQAIQAIKQAINLYNNKRPHLALNFQFPAQVHEKAA